MKRRHIFLLLSILWFGFASIQLPAGSTAQSAEATLWVRGRKEAIAPPKPAKRPRPAYDRQAMALLTVGLLSILAAAITIRRRRDTAISTNSDLPSVHPPVTSTQTHTAAATEPRAAALAMFRSTLANLDSECSSLRWSTRTNMDLVRCMVSGQACEALLAIAEQVDTLVYREHVPTDQEIIELTQRLASLQIGWQELPARRGA